MTNSINSDMSNSTGRAAPTARAPYPAARLAWVPAALCAALCLRLFVFTEDDAFIFFRYAENLAAGLGPVFNPGERVEGFTSPAWTFLLAACARLGLGTIWPAKLLGTGAAVGLVVVFHRSVRALLPRNRAKWAFVEAALLAMTAGLALRSVSGMETTSYALVWTLGAFALLRELRDPERLPRSACWAAIAVWSRPEGLLLFGFVLAVQLRRLVSSGVSRGAGRKRAAVVAGGIFTVCLLFAWRWLSYHDWLPNTYYAKGDLPIELALANGTRYVLRFAVRHGGPLLLLAAIPAMWPPLCRDAGEEKTTPGETSWTYRAALLVLAASLAAVVWEGGDFMVGWRFMIPLIPLWIFLSGEGIRSLCERFEGRRGSRWTLVTGVGFFLLFTYVLPQVGDHVRMGRFVRRYAETQERAYIIPARAIRDVAPKGSSVAMEDVGAFPYYSGLRTIDLVGLVEHHIARLPGGQFEKQGFEPGYVLDQAPTYVVLRNAEDPRKTKTFRGFSDQAIALRHDPRFSRDYSLMWILEAPNAFLEYWVRRDRPDAVPQTP